MFDLGLMPVTAFSLLVGEDLKECGKSACRRIRMGVGRDSCRLVDGISPWRVLLPSARCSAVVGWGRAVCVSVAGFWLCCGLLFGSRSDAEEKENKKSGLSHDCPDLTIK